MRILVTNDDGIFAPGLWALVKELKSIAEVIVAAPDREQSAIGTAITLRQPLRVQKIQPLVPGVTAYSIEGTPADSVTLALGKLVDGIDLVISGINHGLNLGDDVAISGTVSAARQGYLLGVPAFAISLAAASQPYVDNAARLATLLTKRITADGSSPNVFLNINLPDLPVAEIKGIKITCLASESHTDTVEEGHDGRRKYYWLVRHRLDRDTLEGSDMWAVDRGIISITPLHNHQSTNSFVSESLCSDLFQELASFTPLS